MERFEVLEKEVAVEPISTHQGEKLPQFDMSAIFAQLSEISSEEAGYEPFEASGGMGGRVPSESDMEQ